MTEATLISLVIGVCTVVGAAAGAWGAVRFSLGSLTAQVESLGNWLESVSNGETEHMGRALARLDRLEDDSKDHGGRLNDIEIRCARRTSKGETCD